LKGKITKAKETKEKSTAHSLNDKILLII